MRPYGQKIHHHNYPDNHPPKGYMNWWEAEMPIKSKKTERQKAIEIDDCDWETNEPKEKPKGKCELCLHYELVARVRPYCRLFGKHVLTKREKKHCWIFDSEKETQRIESKSF